MKNSVIIRCYNTLQPIKKCVEAAIQSTSVDTEIILVNNHSPYKDVIEYLRNLNHPRVIILDPERNIGNLEGFNYGAKKAKGENLIILDDDIIVPNNNWIHVMSQALDDSPNLAYIGLVASHSKPLVFPYNKNPQDKIIQKSDYTMQFANIGIIFGCVMVKKHLWQQHFSKIKLMSAELFDIDAPYKNKANELGMETGYIISHLADHFRSSDSDQLYIAWKVLYIFKLTKIDYVEWRKNKKTFTIEEEYTLRNNGYTDNLIEYLKNVIANVSL